MKKLIFTIASSFLIISQSQSQITISSVVSAIAGTNDSVKSVSIVSLPGLTLPAATNKTWDITGLSYSGAGVYRHVAIPAGTPFAAAQYADSAVYEISSGSGVSYTTDEATQASASGLNILGEYIYHQHISLTGVTGGANDSLGFPAQDILYSSPKTVLKFPMTYNTNWTTTSKYTTNFEVTVALFSLTDVPAQRVTSYTVKDSVIGWGKMRVKNIAGDSTAYMDVLQVKTIYTTEDSFYLAGSPAPATLLAGFGLVQGMITSLFEENFYRLNEVTPLLKVEYADSTFTTPVAGEVHTQRLAVPTAVENISLANDVHVYPNPVTDHTIAIELPKYQNGSWSYQLMNTAGHIITSSSLPSHGGIAHIHLSSAVTPGVYYLRLSNDGKQACIKAVNIIN